MPASSELLECILKDMKKRGFKIVSAVTIYSFLQGVMITKMSAFAKVKFKLTTTFNLNTK